MQEKLDASKPVVTAAAKSESKMDACKRKVALETKNKGVAEADKTLRCGRNETNLNGMDAEAKNFEGLKEQNKLFARLKLDLA
jgi:hypothetical protein